MYLFYSPCTSPDFKSEIPICLFSANGLLNKAYSEAFFRRFWSFLPVYFLQKAWIWKLIGRKD